MILLFMYTVKFLNYLQLDSNTCLMIKYVKRLKKDRASWVSVVKALLVSFYYHYEHKKTQDMYCEKVDK